MVNCIATCGDSFGTGSGLDPSICFEKSFAGVTAEYFGLIQKVYARGGCCNFTIFLQVKKIIQQIKQKKFFLPFVLITVTHHERLIIPLDNGVNFTHPDLSQIDYESYIPYHLYGGHRPIEFQTVKPRLLTQTISNIDLILKERSGSIGGYFNKIELAKLETLGWYYSNIFDTGVKKETDDALFVYMHMLLKQNNIPHLILGYSLPSVIDQKNQLEIHWGEYTTRYPDSGGSGHCNEEGNMLVGQEVIKHIEKYNLI
jgi:hypothetical protein